MDAATTWQKDLLELERAGWQALAASPEAARAFYDEVLADAVLMLFPGGTTIADRAAAVRSLGGAPWSSFELGDERVLPLGAGSAAVTYRARARRGDAAYEALFASIYVRRGDGWRLALHQQTPC